MVPNTCISASIGGAGALENFFEVINKESGLYKFERMYSAIPNRGGLSRKSMVEAKSKIFEVIPILRGLKTLYMGILGEWSQTRAFQPPLGEQEHLKKYFEVINQKSGLYKFERMYSAVPNRGGFSRK